MVVACGDGEMFERTVLEWYTEGHPEVENDSDQTQCLILLDDDEQRCVAEVWWLVNEECFVYDGEEVYDVLAWAYWPSIPKEIG